MNLELDEEYGAGFEGTKALLYKYIKDTPGQSIQQYMKTKNLSEILKKSDPVGEWIRDFIDSDNSRFSGKSKKERIKMALGAYYAAQRNESTTEVELEESTVSASQINRYIDTENWKAIADLMKGLNDDEHELWAKNGYDGRTYELMMKARKKTHNESTELVEDMIDTLIQQFRDSGRVAVRYLKKKTISVSGINMPEKDAVEKMKKILGVKESTQIDEMRELYAVVDTTDGTVVATSSSEDGAKRSIRSAHLPPISSEHPSKLKIVKTKKTAQVGYPIKEETEIGLDTLRLMKIVSLATGSKDMDALYEYASTSPSYSSIIELKEAFNKYIQQA
jgi:hypothetical protein